MVAGLGLSIFSKPLAVLLGLFIVGLQTAESYGIHLIPYRQLQKYATSIDLRSAVQDNAAFKISFGMMFAAWTLGIYWISSAMVGDPAGQDKRDDGMETVLTLRNSWERWLMKAAPE